MFGTQNRRLFGALAVAAIVAVYIGCSSTPPALEGEMDATAGPISAVEVDSSASGSVVSLVGAGASPYQAEFVESPSRVVITMPGTAVEGAPESTAVFDGYIQEVLVASSTDDDEVPLSVVEVYLSDDSDYDVLPSGNRLEIRIGSPELASAGDEASDEYADLSSETLEDGEDWVELGAEGDALESEMSDGIDDAAEFGDELAADAMDDAGEWVEAAPLVPATRLTGVEPEGSELGTVVRIAADGMPSGVESFTLSDPARLVIDLPGIKSDIEDQQMLVGSAHVDKIRVGQHADKVRVVMDGGTQDNPFDGRQMSPVPNGLVIALGSGDAVETALSDARDALANPPRLAASSVASDWGADDSVDELLGDDDEQPLVLDPSQVDNAPSIAGALIEGVEFVPSADSDTVVVRSDRPIDYTVFKPDSETYVLLFSGAMLSSDASTQLLPEAGGPVSLVSAFAQPELETPEVRLVIKRAAGLEPSLSQVGNEVVLGFARGEGGAATLPVLAEGDVEGAASAASEKAMAQADAEVAMPLAGEVGPGEQQFEVPAAIDSDTAVDYLQEGGLLDGKEYVGRRISLDFKDVDIRDVLRLIADVSDLNVIAGDEVQGNVTIRLVDVPWDQALDVILLTKGLGFVRVGNVLRIAPADVLKVEEEARLQERRAKEKLEDLVVKLQPVNYADVEEIKTLVQRLLTPRGSVDTDKRTNTVIIKDIPAVIDEATALVKAIDTQTPQVMIEARIVEANLDFSREIGAELGFGSNPDEDEEDFTLGGVQPVTVPGTKFPFNQANNVVFENPITSTPTGLLNLGAFILDDEANVDFRLTAAELNGEGKVISSPRVVTLDNREALIEQGVSIPFQTFENGDAQLEFIDAVLSLKVTPHITADRSIIMSIEVSRNAPDGSVETPTGSPAIAKNEAKTETLVKDGQTLVIGGIYVIDKSETQSRVPYLWEMPVLGHLFKNSGLRDQRKELLIFVTPSVVTGQAVDAAAG